MKGSKNILVKQVSRGTLYAVVASLVLVLAFALVIKLTAMSSGAIQPIVQVIKVASIFYGVTIALRQIEKHGYVWGAVVGLLYTVFAFFIFSILDNNFSISVGLLNDMFFAAAIGAISAIVVKMGRANTI